MTLSERQTGWLFLLLALLQLVPIWSVHYLPTTDGPSHLYNSWVMRELLSGHRGLIADYFAIDWRPHPNWIGTAFMAALMTILPPLVAEKIFVSIIVLLFALGARMFAASAQSAMIALLFTFNWLLQMGFYNHSLGVALFFITIALWWRRRDQPNSRTIAIIATLLIINYFANPMMVLLTIASIGLLWLIASRNWRHLIAFVPVTPLIIWYLRVSSADPIDTTRPAMHKLLSYLLRGRILFTFDQAQSVIALLVLVVILASLWPAIRARNIFVALFAMFIILYFAAPESFGRGLFLRERLALLVFLAPIAWIRIPQRTWAVAIVAVIVISNVAYLTIRFHQSSEISEETVRSFDAAEPERTMIAIPRANKPPGGNFALMWHVADYAAIERRLIDINDYEADTRYFPNVSRPEPKQMVLIQADKP